ncbi:CBF1-interacting co-repressor CIR, N-terminal domain containing protein [Trema orientale]|uniref:CBF1-interacting co-repressor CIR, N-terminal domain containing protein n=1 Tax=Trema orientale TaxID=63057 RepID=A0A2P5F5E4_TREOI|nr:CBF1-interacting co-repressor CIR, N-terminal domain containing protein [Trema orientale]
MGGHGGLNILPQKRWNVYNFENREKVRKDEEAAAKEEQLKREQARKRDSEYRLEQLRAARGLAPVIKAAAAAEGPNEPQPKSAHINLFEGIKIFDPIKGSENERERGDERDGGSKKKMKLMKKEEAEKTKVVSAEDEKYRLGYGLAGKGVKLPWYLERRGAEEEDGLNVEGGQSNGSSTEEAKKSGRKKKTMEELREERLRREKREKERERALITPRDRDRDRYRVRDGANPRHRNRKFSRSIVFGIESFALQFSAFVDILVLITGVA